MFLATLTMTRVMLVTGNWRRKKWSSWRPRSGTWSLILRCWTSSLRTTANPWQECRCIQSIQLQGSTTYVIITGAIHIRIARWFIFNPVLVHFGSPLNEKYWYLSWPFGTLCGHLFYFMAIWYIYALAICYIIPILVRCIKKNLATLILIMVSRSWHETEYYIHLSESLLFTAGHRYGSTNVNKNIKQLFSLRDTAMCLRSQRPLHVQGIANHPG
jgi:hypothetical protein